MTLYEDQLITISTPNQPAVKGHVFLQEDGLPKNEADFAHLLSAASFSSMVLFEQLGAHGTNILLTADSAQVLARTETDGLNLMWKPKTFTPQELDDLASKIKDKCDYIDVPQEKKSSLSSSSSKESQNSSPTKEKSDSQPDDSVKNKEGWPAQKNYLLKQLDRMP